MSTIKFEKEILELINNRQKIPDDFWQLAENGQRVIWILDQPDGTAGSYETSNERLGVTKEGFILWGYSSGCSCWDGWNKDDYNATVEYKEFAVMKIGEFAGVESNYDDSQGPSRYTVQADKTFQATFSRGWQDECYNNLMDYLMMIRENPDPLSVLKARNAEVRRYLMKRIGYDKIRALANVKSLHIDGTSELLEISPIVTLKDADGTPLRNQADQYVKVKDSSTDREYLLYVPNNFKTCKAAIAWTFGLSESEYNPIIET